MNQNNAIRCDVSKCRYNNGLQNCTLESIKVTCCSGDHCTCCGDFSEK